MPCVTSEARRSDVRDVLFARHLKQSEECSTSSPKKPYDGLWGVPHFGGRGYQRPKLYMQNPNKL